MKKIILLSFSIMLLFTLSSCRDMIKNEIVNSITVADEMLPMQLNEATICNRIYYNKLANAIVIEYITLDNAVRFFEVVDDKETYLKILNTEENKKLLKRCAKANINIRVINRTQSGVVLIDNTFFPSDYYSKEKKN